MLQPLRTNGGHTTSFCFLMTPTAVRYLHVSSWETKAPPGSGFTNRLDYDYTTLTHRLDAFVAGLTTQKRSASSLPKLDDSRQSKRPSRRVSATTPQGQAGSFIAESSDTSPPSRPGKSHQSKCGGKRLSPKTTNVDIFITPGLGTSPASQPEEGPQSHSRVRPASAKTPQAGSLTTQSGDMPYNPYLELAPQVHIYPAYQEIETSGFTEIASRQSCFDYGYLSEYREVRSMNQYPEVEEIGTSKCGDDMSQSTNLDSAYGSRNSTIPSSSNSYEPIISPKSDRGDSAIASSSNASVRISSPATGRAVQDVSNQVSQPYLYPPELDLSLPSSILTPDEKRDFGFSSDLLDRDSYDSLDQHYQKYEVSPKKNLETTFWLWIYFGLLELSLCGSFAPRIQVAWVLLLWIVTIDYSFPCLESGHLLGLGGRLVLILWWGKIQIYLVVACSRWDREGSQMSWRNGKDSAGFID